MAESRKAGPAPRRRRGPRRRQQPRAEMAARPAGGTARIARADLLPCRRAGQRSAAARQARRRGRPKPAIRRPGQRRFGADPNGLLAGAWHVGRSSVSTRARVISTEATDPSKTRRYRRGNCLRLQKLRPEVGRPHLRLAAAVQTRTPSPALGSVQFRPTVPPGPTGLYPTDNKPVVVLACSPEATPTYPEASTAMACLVLEGN